jgi:hypothetical protein
VLHRLLANGERLSVNGGMCEYINLAYALVGVLPENICVSSRRPRTLGPFAGLGVDVCFDNVKVRYASPLRNVFCDFNFPASQVVKTCRVVMLLCLPAQLSRVADECRGLLRRRCVILSFLLGCTEERIAALFHTSPLAIVRTQVVSEWRAQHPVASSWLHCDCPHFDYAAVIPYGERAVA